jgi:pimeloyl-ACP methyl ester carboxylesterase
MARFAEGITGRYVYLTVQGTEYRVYFEEAGQGTPILCQHTAGSDGRQYRHLLEDPEITQDFRVVAYDLPFHGRSLPPTSRPWWSERYSLDQAFLVEFVTAFAAALELEGGIYMGCSMGGHLAPDLALIAPGLFRAVLAIQGGLATHDPEPFNKWLSHPRTSNESKAAPDRHGQGHRHGRDRGPRPGRRLRLVGHPRARAGPGRRDPGGDVHADGGDGALPHVREPRRVQVLCPAAASPDRGAFGMTYYKGTTIHDLAAL